MRSQLASLGPEDNLVWQRHPADRLPGPALERMRRHQHRLQALAEGIDWEPMAAGAGGGPPGPGAVRKRAAPLEAALMRLEARLGGLEAASLQVRRRWGALNAGVAVACHCWRCLLDARIASA